MPVQNAVDLFVHELGDLYDAEQRIVQMLPQLANESISDQARDAYQSHEQQTRQQIRNLDQIFQMVGIQPPRVTCAAMQGLKQEHDTFVRDGASQDALTLFDLVAADKTEHYEIASYRNLIEMANVMGQQDVAQLLQQNLRQEEEMAQRVEQMGRQLVQQSIQRIMQTGQYGQPQPGQQPGM